MEIFWAYNSKSLDLFSEVCPARLGKVGLIEEKRQQVGKPGLVSWPGD